MTRWTGKGAVAKLDNKFPDPLGALYQDAVDNIRLCKQQCWSVTNYVGLIYAAIVPRRRMGSVAKVRHTTGAVKGRV
jgi:hypothetical protein